MSLWRDREFLKLWTGQMISEVGSRVSREGIPLTAVLLLNASPVQMGFLASVNGVTALLFGPLAGILADRLHRRPILIVTDLSRAAVLALIPLAALSGSLQLWHLFAVAALAGILTVFFDVAYQSYLPALVPEPQLLEGNSKLALSASTAEAIGPGITGVLVQWLSAPRAIALDAFSFLVSAVSVLAIRRPERPVTDQPHEPGWNELTAGFRTVASNPTLRALALRSVTMFFFAGFFSSLYVFYAIRTLGLTPIVLGFVVTLGGISNFFGASIAARLPQTWPVRNVLIASTLGSGAIMLFIPLAHGPWYLAAAFLGAAQLFGDLFFPIYSIYELTLRQRIAPPAVLGRVNAAMQMIWKGIIPAGAVTGGFLAESLGPRAAIVISAFGVMASALWLRRIPGNPEPSQFE